MPVDRIVFRLNLDFCSSVSILFPISYVFYVCANNDTFWSLQRFYMVKPCPKEMKCDVEVSSNLT
jgi:hypothetical protein